FFVWPSPTLTRPGFFFRIAFTLRAFPVMAASWIGSAQTRETIPRKTSTTISESLWDIRVNTSLIAKRPAISQGFFFAKLSFSTGLASFDLVFEHLEPIQCNLKQHALFLGVFASFDLIPVD